MKIVKAVLIDSLDNCVTLSAPAEPGDTVSFMCNGVSRAVVAQESIPIWHKAAPEPIEKGEPVRKYGSVIGVAFEHIEAGCHIHTHNIRSERKGVVE